MAKSRPIVAAALVMALTLPAPPGARAASDIYAWHEGADGYAHVLAKAQEGDRPFLLLFSVDWCGYCRRLKQHFLDVSPFEDVASDYLRVVVDPEQGAEEGAVAKAYNVTGYPTFLVLFPGQEKPYRIGPFGGGKESSVEEFADQLKKALAWSYCTRGVSFWPKGDHRRSLSFFETALSLVPDYPWGHYGLGVALWRTGRAEGNDEFLRKGEASLVRALQLRPGYESAQKELALVQAELKLLTSGR